MENRELVDNSHRKIVAECERRIGSSLTESERNFITSRIGFISLEMIEDTVMSMRGEELESYLNSETR